MDEEQVKSLKEYFEAAHNLRRRSNNIEQSIAETVGDAVNKCLQAGKKVDALKIINDVYSNEDYEDEVTAEKHTFWFLHFQKIIYNYMG